MGRGCAESVRPSKSFFQLLPYYYSFFRCCFFFYFCVFHIFCFFDLYYFCFYQFYCSCFYFCVYATVGAAWTAAGPCADRCGRNDEAVAPQDFCPPMCHYFTAGPILHLLVVSSVICPINCRER